VCLKQIGDPGTTITGLSKSVKLHKQGVEGINTENEREGGC